MAQKGTFHRALAVIVLVLAGGRPLVAQEPGTAPPIEWPPFETAVEKARVSGKLVLIDIFSPRCGWCRKLQTEVYTQADLQEFVFEHFELGRLDIDVIDDTVSFSGHELSSAHLAAGLGATGTPTTIFLEPTGGYITRLGGFHPYEDFFDVLRFIGTESFREMSFEDYVKEQNKE